MGVKDEQNPITVMPYKVNKSFNDSYERHKSDDPNNFHVSKQVNLDENLNSHSDNFDDVMKKTVAEINKEEDDTLHNETNKNDDLYCKIQLFNLLVKTGSRLPNSMIDLTTTNIDMKIDPFIELSVERVIKKL